MTCTTARSVGHFAKVGSRADDVTTCLEVASSYTRAELCVLPANLADKHPDVGSWKQYQNRLPTDDELRRWFKRDRPMCLVAGAASNNLEMIDFDCAGEAFAGWKQLVEAAAPGLLDTLVIERSPSGGWHVVYRHDGEVFGSHKLAERAVVVPDDQEVEFYGKTYKPRKVGDHYEVWLTLIETRGEGGIFLCDPTPGYVLKQGSFTQLPVLPDEQRMLLLETAWSLNELKRQAEPDVVTTVGGEPNGRPGDDFNERGDVRRLLREHGWTLSKGGENEYWRRPGKTSGTSATLKDGVLYVFSSNAAPFEPNRHYSPFAVYSLLEHNGDFIAAATTLRSGGYGSDETPTDVDLSQLDLSAKSAKDDTPAANKKILFTAITSKELDDNEYELTYLIEGMLVRGQPGVIAGPKKTLKTNISIDLALSLSDAGLFLNRFNVPEAVRVGVMSGESGAATIQETARRIAYAKQRRLSDFNNVVWSFEVPQLGNVLHTDGLRDFIKRYELDVLILDPTYLMMLALGDNAGNLFIVGSFLKSLGDLAQETGCTPLLCHHLKKGIADPYEPAELENIAWAGFQEFVRQWMLLNRRVRYDPDVGGHHELWMSVGGSAGHSGVWGVNIDEGTRQDSGGRCWEVDVITAGEAYSGRAEAEQDAAEQRKSRQHDAKFQRQREAALNALKQFPDGETPRVIRELAGIGARTIQSVLDVLTEEGEIVACTVQKNTRREPAFRLATPGGPGGP